MSQQDKNVITNKPNIELAISKNTKWTNFWCMTRFPMSRIRMYTWVELTTAGRLLQ